MVDNFALASAHLMLAVFLYRVLKAEVASDRASRKAAIDRGRARKKRG